jgi:hypothetical protein
LRPSHPKLQTVNVLSSRTLNLEMGFNKMRSGSESKMERNSEFLLVAKKLHHEVHVFESDSFMTRTLPYQKESRSLVNSRTHPRTGA